MDTRVALTVLMLLRDRQQCSVLYSTTIYSFLVGLISCLVTSYVQRLFAHPTIKAVFVFVSSLSASPRLEEDTGQAR